MRYPGNSRICRTGVGFSGNPVIQLSRYPVILLSGYPVIRLSGYPVIWLSGNSFLPDQLIYYYTGLLGNAGGIVFYEIFNYWNCFFYFRLCYINIYS